MKAKQAMLISFVVVLVIGLTACNTKLETVPPSSAGTQTTAADTETVTAEPTATQSKFPSYLNMDSEFPIVKEGEKVTLTLVASQDDALGGKAEDLWFWKWAKQKMNIDFKVEQVLSSAVDERKQLMFASGTLPDMFVNMRLSTMELVTYGQNEKQLLALNDYITTDYTPALCLWYDAYPDIRSICTCPDGNMYTLPQISAENDEGALGRIFINQNWLTAVNMKTPETLDDFITMLRAFRDGNPGKAADANKVIPLGGGFNALDPRYYFLNALGFITYDGNGISAALRDGKVVIPAGDTLFLEYLKIMNQLYSEKLISEDFFTLDDTQVRAQAVEGLIGVFAEPAYLSMPNSFQDWWAVKPLTSQWNPKQQWPKTNRINIGGFAVSSTSQYPEVCLRFADFAYTDLGAKYVWSGPMVGPDTLGLVGGWYINDKGENLKPDVVSGKWPGSYEYYVGAVTGTYGAWGNMTEYSFAHQKEKYSLMHELAGMEGFKKVYDPENGDDHYRMSVMENLLPYIVDAYPAYTYFTNEENTRISDLRTVIENYVKTEIAKFITGARPLSDFDAYLKELKSLGIEEYTKYYSDAYDNYVKSIK